MYIYIYIRVRYAHANVCVYICLMCIHTCVHALSCAFEYVYARVRT